MMPFSIRRHEKIFFRDSFSGVRTFLSAHHTTSERICDQTDQAAPLWQAAQATPSGGSGSCALRAGGIHASAREHLPT